MSAAPSKAASNRDPSVFVMRRVLPVAVGITIVFGCVRFAAGSSGMVSDAAGVGLMTAVAVSVLTGASLWSARALRAAMADQRVADRDDLYRMLARNYPGGGIFLFDRELRYVLAEGGSFSDVGLDRRALEGRTIWEALEPEAAALVEAPYRAALEGEHVSFEMDFRDRVYRVTVVPTYDDAGEIVGGLAQTQELTQQKRLEAQLRQSQKLEAVGQLAGGVAHDFNNLLTVISGYASMPLLGADGEQQSREALAQISNAARRAGALTQQLLAFSRQQVLEPQLVDLNEVVEEILPMLRRLIEERIDLLAQLGTDLPPVLVDRGQLEQVVMNLVLNARDAIDGSGTITVGTRHAVVDAGDAAHRADVRVGPHVVLSVSDTGVGMDAPVLERVFEPFFTTKPVGVGTGLGLSTVHGIVAQSGGSVRVDSEPGAGATFTVSIPAAAGEPSQRGAARAAPEAAAPEATILVVEDHEAVRVLTRRLLEAAGYGVVATSSAAEAAEALASGAVDLVLTDLVLPDASGDSIAGLADARGRRPPLVFMSGYADAAVLHDRRLAAGSGFLAKPFTPSALLATVADVLASRA